MVILPLSEYSALDEDNPGQVTLSFDFISKFSQSNAISGKYD
jgi:hypothetical protein